VADEKVSLTETGLRQGVIFSSSDPVFHTAAMEGRAAVKHRKKKIDANSLLLVLSQDCDIEGYASSKQHIEVVIIKPRTEVAGLMYARAYHKLQIPFNNAMYECEADLISLVYKKPIDHDKLTIKGAADTRALESIIEWRVGRYNRIAFPDGFNREFIQKYIKEDGNELGEYLKVNREPIINIHVWLSPANIEDADNYFVTVTALIRDDVDDAKRGEIESILGLHLKILDQAENNLTMLQCNQELIPDDFNAPLEFVLSTDEMTINDVMAARKLNLDYICYIEEDEEE
jgi:hypothetical protein